MEFQVKISGMLIKSEAENEKDLIRKAAFFQSLPQECPLCKSPVHFFYRSPQDYDYYGLQCEGKVMHETNFGQFKDGKGLFYKQAWDKAFQERADNQPPPPEVPYE